MDKLVNIYRGNEQLFEKVKLAGSFGAKLRGLMFYREMPAIDGLLLYPCNTVHLFWMRFPLDLIYLSRERVVLFIETKSPNQLGSYLKNAYYVLETEAGTGASKNIRVGDRIRWE